MVNRPRINNGPVLPKEGLVWLHFVVIAISGCVIPHLLFAWAEQYVSSSLASIYNAVTPIMTALMATLAFRVETPVQLTTPVVLSLLALGALGTGVAYMWNIHVLRAWGARSRGDAASA
jgi:VIT1/CCC1 family predicted Fe2+/Mn2+ transporter